MANDCPQCGLLNPPSAQRCDCGYDFLSRPQVSPSRTGVRGSKASYVAAWWQSLALGSSLPRLVRPRAGMLILSHSKARHLVELLFLAGFLFSWYGFLIGEIPSDVRELIGKLQAAASKDAFSWIFMVAPVFSLPVLWRSIGVILRGESLSLDATTRTFTKNGSLVARFDQIEAVQIRTIYAQRSRRYVLSMMLRDGGKIPIAQGWDLVQVTEIADAMSDMTGAKVIAKE